MTAGTIHNVEEFLNKIAGFLGRDVKTEGVVRPKWEHQPQWNIGENATSDTLLPILKEQCKNIHTDLVETDLASLGDALKSTVADLGGGPVITWNDERFAAFGLADLLETNLDNEVEELHIWDPALGQVNVTRAEKANVGITFSDQTLAESGTVVLFSDKNKGRTVSLLPKTYIAIVPKSTLVQRLTQVTHAIHKKIENGEDIASCINFISGPSNSADIEMNLVVGVHGPVRATYIIVMDK